MDEADKINWLRLIRTEGVGPITFYRLLERFGTTEKALKALPDLAKKGGRAKPLTAQPLEAIEKELRILRKSGGDIVCACEDSYPLPLSATEDAPPVLSYLGDLSLATKECIGIVGARNASHQGRKFADKIAGELGAAGQIVVSGLARGIDTAAHKGALVTGTIAVVAGGLDVIYPEENKGLYSEIREKGLILAESALGQQPVAQSFPKRNRIISGLSSGVVVVEASLRSGSLITARVAAEQGRDVYAVPGFPLDPRAEGPNKLLRDGAILVQETSDILDNLRSFTGQARGLSENVIPFTPPPAIDPADTLDDIQIDDIRTHLLSSLSGTPSNVDELIRETQCPPAIFQSALIELELAGKVQRLAGNRVSLVR